MEEIPREQLPGVADKLFHLINDGNVYALVFLVFILIYAGQRLCAQHHHQTARSFFAIGFLLFCLYGFFTLKPTDMVEIAVLAFRGLLAGGLVFGAFLVILPPLSTFLGVPLRKLKSSSASYRRKRSQRREEREKQQQEAEEEEQQRRYFEEHPPLSASQIHEQQVEEAQAKWARDQELINNGDFELAEKQRSLKFAKQKYLKKIRKLMEE